MGWIAASCTASEGGLGACGAEGGEGRSPLRHCQLVADEQGHGERRRVGSQLLRRGELAGDDGGEVRLEGERVRRPLGVARERVPPRCAEVGGGGGVTLCGGRVHASLEHAQAGLREGLQVGAVGARLVTSESPMQCVNPFLQQHTHKNLSSA